MDPANDDQERADRYRRHKKRVAEHQAEDSRAGRDIADIPPIADAARRGLCRLNFRLFCELYFPEKFGLGWSADHLLAIERIEGAVLRGGLFALAMPRGGGKTTLAECAVIWAVAYGHRRFVVLVGAAKEHAVAMLENVKVELETNDLLYADFPEVCHAIRHLEAIAQKAGGQQYQGKRTYIRWKTDEIVVPTIPGSQASGCRVRARGISGRINGMKATLADRSSVRPDLVIIDDPQTMQSAHSASQCKKRLGVLTGSILGLAGPGQRIAGVMPCTVMVPGDLADQILDREKYPQWQGLRTKLVEQWPDATELWEQYLRIRADSLRAGHGGAGAIEFYRAHREAMDGGSRVAWQRRKRPEDESAIQHAYDLRQDLGTESFDAEYQNQPQRPEGQVEELTPEEICAKANGIPRGMVPDAATDLTAFIDVNKPLLYWAVAAWKRDFTGHLVDYNAWPDPKRKYFRMKEVPGTLMKRHRGAGLEGAIHAGLDELVNFLMDCEWSSESGSTLRIGRILIDYGWGETSTTVLEFCRRSPHAAIILPAKGKGIGIKSNPMEEWPHHEGEIRGHHWIVARAKAAKGKKAGRETQRITVDTNYWKTMLHERLAYAAGDAGGLTLFGQASDHQMLAQHLLAEARVRKALPGRTVDEWSLSEKPDNHLGDCIVGNFVAAEHQGAVISVRISEATRQARKKLAKAAKAKKAGRPKVRYFQ